MGPRYTQGTCTRLCGYLFFLLLSVGGIIGIVINHANRIRRADVEFSRFNPSHPCECRLNAWQQVGLDTMTVFSHGDVRNLDVQRVMLDTTVFCNATNREFNVTVTLADPAIHLGNVIVNQTCYTDFETVVFSAPAVFWNADEFILLVTTCVFVCILVFMVLLDNVPPRSE